MRPNRLSYRAKRRATAAVVLLIALGAWFSATQPVFGPQTRFDIIMAVILSQTVVLAWLVLKLFELLAELRNQHAAAAHVRTARGIWQALQVYADGGGVDPGYRSKLHAAGDEQFRLYDEVLARDPGRPQTKANAAVTDVFANGQDDTAVERIREDGSAERRAGAPSSLRP